MTIMLQLTITVDFFSAHYDRSIFFKTKWVDFDCDGACIISSSSSKVTILLVTK